jgi:hypothetical protein
MATYQYSADYSGPLPVPDQEAFDFLDDQSNLSAHMGKKSWMMLGSTMEIFMDAQRTREVGSQFGFKGSIVGVPLFVREVVTFRQPPESKRWKTVEEPVLWVIGAYEMYFEIRPETGGANLTVGIEYQRPLRGFPRFLSIFFHRIYARWCTKKMVIDAQRHFSSRRPRDDNGRHQPA